MHRTNYYYYVWVSSIYCIFDWVTKQHLHLVKVYRNKSYQLYFIIRIYLRYSWSGNDWCRICSRSAFSKVSRSFFAKNKEFIRIFKKQTKPYFFEISRQVYIWHYVHIRSLYLVNRVIDKQVVLEEINQDRKEMLYDNKDYFVGI
jgi:hypothetical protein